MAQLQRGAGPVTPLLAVDIAATYDSTCAVDRTGTLWCWGRTKSDAETASEVSSTLPHPVDLGGRVRAIDGSYRLCAVLVDGEVVCIDPQGETQAVRARFTRPATAVIVTEGSELIRLDDGSYLCTRGLKPCTDRESVDAARGLADGDIVCFGDRMARSPDKSCERVQNVLLGVSPKVCGDARTWKDGCEEDVVSRATTATDGCKLMSSGEVRCAGAYARRLLQSTDTAEPPFFDPYVTVPLPEPASKIVGGDGHLCALGRSGRVWCWGDNSKGQVGLAPRGNATCVGALDPIGAVIDAAGGAR